mmetsp:Transcript_2696/g.7918  ORF Transcript_2696/g.7918 Transcript_2696/m.7918 type:complete len:586 (-) Transcript_2696:167-1924(-)|eukprot:CAMPEP_0181044168 /NCGR_PEP_ID=MMETSP1070-20121207/13113_1 /TAXON_ID=265543 /ORGANISM="Minutocellus polymorphus, Strain NH13" /LENGTH=585 /DNA_ID=CAMNT_0023122577 /DNA_START=120 /DNA_END=1877 /DNA_ORIENTATION=-
MSAPPPQPSVQVLDLSAESLAARREHELMLLDLEAKKRAYQVDVPTLVDDVRSALRAMGLPVRVFGENLADVRDRLRMELARREVLKEGGAKVDSALDLMVKKPGEATAEEEGKGGEKEITKYTVAEPELVAAREEIAKFSTKRARARLARERSRREAAKKRGEENNVNINVNGKRPLDKANVVEPDAASAGAGDANGTSASADDEDILTKLDQECLKLYKSVRNMCLEGSQFADARPLSAICTSPPAPGYAMDSRGDRPALIATGGWSGAVRIWDGSLGSTTLDPLATKTQGHEDRIMGIAMAPFLGGIESKEYEPIVATASIDLTGKLWKVRRNDCVPMPMEEDDEGGNGTANKKKSNEEVPEPYVIEELATLRGHAARLGRVAFHPSGRYVATTSFDHTWRLWDVETGGTQLLLQDGMWKECYGIGMHPDGSLCATTDFGGTIQCWDLRTGKSACHFTGAHARRVLCSEFAPNGFHMATAGDDGTLKVWDLRRRGTVASVPAHSRLITQIRFAHDVPGQNGEFVTTSSFDGTVKVWSTRDWRMLSMLQGHEGKVMGVDVISGAEGTALVSSGFDKTLKLWKE